MLDRGRYAGPNNHLWFCQTFNDVDHVGILFTDLSSFPEDKRKEYYSEFIKEAINYPFSFEDYFEFYCAIDTIRCTSLLLSEQKKAILAQFFNNFFKKEGFMEFKDVSEFCKIIAYISSYRPIEARVGWDSIITKNECLNIFILQSIEHFCKTQNDARLIIDAIEKTILSAAEKSVLYGKVNQAAIFAKVEQEVSTSSINGQTKNEITSHLEIPTRAVAKDDTTTKGFEDKKPTQPAHQEKEIESADFKHHHCLPFSHFFSRILHRNEGKTDKETNTIIPAFLVDEHNVILLDPADKPRDAG